MCGRVNNHLSGLHVWTKMLGEWPSVRQGYNVAPSASLAAFSKGENEQLNGQVMRWGMVPSWSKTFETNYNTHNARIETVHEKPTFRSAWSKQQKCLIPIAGYYEWKAGLEGNKKQPFYVTDKNIGGLALAGLYEPWGEQKDKLFSCTIITKAASKELSSIHPRMPVLMSLDSAKLWFESDLGNDQKLLNDIETPEIAYWPVTHAVGNVSNNNANLYEAIDLI